MGVIREGQTDVSAFSSLADGWIHSVYSLVFLKSSLSTIFVLKTRYSRSMGPRIEIFQLQRLMIDSGDWQNCISSIRMNINNFKHVFTGRIHITCCTSCYDNNAGCWNFACDIYDFGLTLQANISSTSCLAWFLGGVRMTKYIHFDLLIKLSTDIYRPQ